MKYPLQYVLTFFSWKAPYIANQYGNSYVFTHAATFYRCISPTTLLPSSVFPLDLYLSSLVNELYAFSVPFRLLFYSRNPQSSLKVVGNTRAFISSLSATVRTCYLSIIARAFHFIYYLLLFHPVFVSFSLSCLLYILHTHKFISRPLNIKGLYNN